MPLPYSGTHDVNILHSWITMLFWANSICPEMKPGNASALVNRIKNALVEKTEDVKIEDINESQKNCEIIITGFMNVVNKYPYFISYWRFQKRKDETVREYEFEFKN